MSTLPAISFSHDWNHKLQCDVYTTIRPWNEAKYGVGRQYEICLKGARLHRATIVDAVRCTLDKLPRVTAMLDTGYSLAETRAIIDKMYKGSVSEFGLYVLKVLERYDSPGNAGERPGPRPDAVKAKGDVEGSGAMEPLPLPPRLREGKGPEVFTDLAWEVAKAHAHLLLADGDDMRRHRATNQRIIVACMALNPSVTAADMPVMLAAIGRARAWQQREFQTVEAAARRKSPELFKV